MKTIYLSIAASLALLLTACGSGEKMIQAKDLPTEAQQFISATFPGAQVQLAQRDKEIDGTEYKVKLDNGFALEFDSKGLWTQVNGTPQSVPASLIPAAIIEYINMNMPDQTILILERERRGYEIQLLDNTELKFDAQGKLTQWDD